jgi:hypothetical protein
MKKLYDAIILYSLSTFLTIARAHGYATMNNYDAAVILVYINQVRITGALVQLQGE